MPARRDGWLGHILDLLFPPRCAGCGRRDVWLCAPCRAALPKPTPPLCRCCGRPTRGVLTCPDCWRRRPAVDGIHSAFFFVDPLRPMIHRFKYRHARYLAEPLGGLFDGMLERLPAADAIVPVPLHPKRERQRGYNQSALLAGEVSLRLGLPVVSGSLRRARDTPPQMGLSAAERRRNVRDAFSSDGQLAGGRVILLDDVCTTGATLGACATALKRAGVARVTGLTLARARK